jgi:adenylate cyclase class IV
MEKQIEVEIRGKIDDFEKTLEKFHKTAKFIKEKDRFSLIYFRGKVADDVSNIKEEKVDLRVRVTNKKAELVMKYGEWGGSDSREEILIPLSLESFDSSVEFLKCLDWNCGIVMATKTFVFDYKGIEFALVKSKSLNYFEAEKITKYQKKSKEIIKEIKEVCKEFGLETFTNEQFADAVNQMNNTPRAKFDLTKQNFKDIKEEYKEFF